MTLFDRIEVLVARAETESGEKVLGFEAQILPTSGQWIARDGDDIDGSVMWLWYQTTQGGPHDALVCEP